MTLKIQSMEDHPHVFMRSMISGAPIVIYGTDFEGGINDVHAEATARTALRMSCSYLCFNPVRMAEGNTPNVHADFKQAIENTRTFFEAPEVDQLIKDNSIFVFNSSAAQVFLPVIRDLNITMKTGIGIGANLNTHKNSNEGAQAFTEVGLGHDLKSGDIKVRGGVTLYRGLDDERVNLVDSEALANVFDSKAGASFKEMQGEAHDLSGVSSMIQASIRSDIRNLTF